MNTKADTGLVALVGSGEFLAPIEALDRLLLARLHETPRVVILPTASAPDGRGVPERWGRMGVEHFTRLGAVAESVMVLTRADAESQTLANHIARANVVYLSGGKPDYLLQTLRGTACWQAIEGVFASGGIVVGCSAGAMTLSEYLLNVPQFWRTRPGLGLAPGIMVIPHFDEIPSWLTGVVSLTARKVTVVGIEGSTALVGSLQNWEVFGRGSVTVFDHRRKTQYRAGEQVPLAKL